MAKEKATILDLVKEQLESRLEILAKSKELAMNAPLIRDLKLSAYLILQPLNGPLGRLENQTASAADKDAFAALLTSRTYTPLSERTIGRRQPVEAEAQTFLSSFAHYVGETVIRTHNINTQAKITPADQARDSRIGETTTFERELAEIRQKIETESSFVGLAVYLDTHLAPRFAEVINEYKQRKGMYSTAEAFEDQEKALIDFTRSFSILVGDTRLKLRSADRVMQEQKSRIVDHAKSLPTEELQRFYDDKLHPKLTTLRTEIDALRAEGNHDTELRLKEAHEQMISSICRSVSTKLTRENNAATPNAATATPPVPVTAKEGFLTKSFGAAVGFLKKSFGTAMAKAAAVATTIGLGLALSAGGIKTDDTPQAPAQPAEQAAARPQNTDLSPPLKISPAAVPSATIEAKETSLPETKAPVHDVVRKTARTAPAHTSAHTSFAPAAQPVVEEIKFEAFDIATSRMGSATWKNACDQLKKNSIENRICQP